MKREESPVKNAMELKQVDLFGDFRKQTEVMRCIAGYFIGSFSDEDPINPIIQKSIFYTTREEAEAALESGQWPQPEEP